MIALTCDAEKRRKQLLDELSTYDYLRPLKQSRSKRYSSTLDWISQTAEFGRWVDGEVPLLCCFGKSKSPETLNVITALTTDSWIRQDDCYVSMAAAPYHVTALLTCQRRSSVIDHILSGQGSDRHVSFFFAESGSRESLSAETIIRSILRQRLNSVEIPREVVDSLEQLDSSPELDAFVKLLRLMMAPPEISYIIIDGLDECDKADRDSLLAALSSFITLGGNIRLFLSCRDSVRGEIRNRFPTFDSFLMGCPAALNGISRFVDDILEEKLESGELALTDDSLKEDIKQALSDGAQGM